MSSVDPQKVIEKLRNQLQGDAEAETEVPQEADRRHLLKMSDNIRLIPSEVDDFRHRDLLQLNRKIAIEALRPTVVDFEDNGEAEQAGIKSEADLENLLEEEGLLGLALEYRAAAESILRWINDEYTNEYSNQDYRPALRSFGKYRLKREEPPESLLWIPTGTSNSFDPVPSARDLLKWEEDVVPMIEAARNSRDKALIAVQFEAGLRSGELQDLRVRDIFDSEHTTGIHVDGKKGERTVHLIISVPYLNRWLDEHPGGKEDYLWTKLSSPEMPSYNTWIEYLKAPAERAGVSKKVTPTNLRKSNTRWLVLLGYSQPRIEERQGRKRGSEHTAHYMARFGDESNERMYAQLHGLDVEKEETIDVGPVKCPRCRRENPRHKDYCVFCSFGLTFDAAEEAEAQDDRLIESAAEASRPDETTDDQEVTTDDVMKAKQLIRENPSLRRVLLIDS